jgi:hypothetical protein
MLQLISLGTCLEDARHHWPMDKLDGGDLGDIAGSHHGRIETGGEIVNTGPIVHNGFRTAAISLKESDRGTIDLGDLSELQMMNLDWAAG